MSTYTRRHFIRAAGITSALAPVILLPSQTNAFQPFGTQRKSRVVIARDENILSSPNSLQKELLGKMLDEAMRSLGGNKEPLAVWKTLFKSSDVVGIKVNTLGGRMLSPHPEFVYSVAGRLAQAGVPRKRIIVWDRSERELKKAGFTNESAQGRCLIMATDSQGVGYEREPEISGSIGSCFSRLIAKACTAMINFGVLKDHDLSGTSVAMKNLFGLIHNPNRYHFDVNKDPYLPDLCLHSYVKDKLRLTICDGFRGQYDQGPAFNAPTSWQYNGFLMSLDQVAVDSAAARILEAKRKAEGLPPFKEVERDPIYIQLAEEKKVGIADPSKIQIVEASV